MSNPIFTDFASLYPTIINPVQRAYASTIGKDLVAVQPMPPPSGIMSYMNFHYISPWIHDYEHIPGAIRVKIKDTFNNIIDLLENPGIIVAKVLDFKIDVQFIPGASLSATYRSFGKNIGMNSINIMKHFLDSFAMVDMRAKNIQMSHLDPVGEQGEPGIYEDCWHSGNHCPEEIPNVERDTLVEFDIIIYAPLTKFVKRHAIANHNKDYWNEDSLENYTCKRLIEDIFKKKRGRK